MNFKLLALALPLACSVFGEGALRDKLAQDHGKIVYESYVDNNWELFVMNSDGSNAMNLTKSAEHEHYPQVSPDGTKICYTVDAGEGRETIRSLWVMDSDGKNRKKLVEYAREPFWAPDSKTIGFLHQEYPKFNIIDYYTKGMSFYDLATGKTTDHPNAAKLHHLYNPSFAPNGKWIAATVHAGMGFDHAILLIERNGDKIINLGVHGCRPAISPDGKQIAWGSSDHDIETATINLEDAEPKIQSHRVRVTDAKNKIYHVDWSPGSDFLSISHGPESEGDLSKPGTFRSACEIVGVYAKDWNLIAVSAKREGVLDLATATEKDFAPLTTNGLSNKESAWFKPPAAAK
jgi:Tol biopolymer transport system component